MHRKHGEKYSLLKVINNELIVEQLFIRIGMG